MEKINRSSQYPYHGSVVIIEDEENMCTILTKILNQAGYHVTSFCNPIKGLEYFEQYEPDCVITDVKMPEMSGMDILRAIRKISRDTIVIMMTAFATIEGAIQAMKEGAKDYIIKPFKTDELLTKLGNAIEHKRLKEDNVSFSEHFQREYLNIELIGESASIGDIKQLIKKIAPTDSAVLIRGESGTGKELVARAIHKYSKRTQKRFVPINCASIPENLIESELFGYERGAFTGAVQTKQGLIELAHGGTLFLDEIGDLPLALQAKLLRVLQEREIQHVGGLKQLAVDIRLLAATNRDLSVAIENASFRQDLFYRLNVININLPPLRERIDDIEILTKYFIEKLSKKLRKGNINISQDVFPYLKSYTWPGNVRELENIIERILVLLDGSEIRVDDLPEDLLLKSQEYELVDSKAKSDFIFQQPPVSEFYGKDYREAKDIFEKDYICKLLEQAKGSVTEAAKISGMSRRNLYDKMERYGIKSEEFKD